MKALFLIPARGGSKGLPGKNIKELAGKPLIVYSIEQALQTGRAEDVVVSTDSEEIMETARRAGANVPFRRPESLATDTAGSREVMLHAIDFFEKKGKAYDTIVLLQPTSPLRNPADIKRAMELYEQKGPDMVVSVKEARTNPYYNAYEADAEGYLKISKGEGNITRRQDAPEVWEFTGSIYVISVEALKKGAISGFEKILPMPIDAETAIDIDTERDFRLCEELIKKTR